MSLTKGTVQRKPSCSRNWRYWWRLAGFIKALKKQNEAVAGFDSQLWEAMVDYVTVGADKGVTVVFREGTEVR